MHLTNLEINQLIAALRYAVDDLQQLGYLVSSLDTGNDYPTQYTTDETDDNSGDAPTMQVEGWTRAKEAIALLEGIQAD